MTHSLEGLKNVIAEVLDIEESQIEEKTYMIRELNSESIDLLEIGVGLNEKYGIDIDDNQVFLRELRYFIKEAEEKNVTVIGYLQDQYPYLSAKRLEQMIRDLQEGPVLKVEDILNYVDWKRGGFTQ